MMFHLDFLLGRLWNNHGKKYLGTTLREDPVHMLAAPFSDGDFRQNIKEKAQ